MKKVKVEDAVGMILAHDLTKIVPGGFKGAAFKKGSIIKAEDVEELKDIGKNHIFVVELEDDELHENDAARRLAMAVASRNTIIDEPAEGKANIKSAIHGILKINRQALQEINQIGKMALVSLHSYSVVNPGQIIAAAKIIPLTIQRKAVEIAETVGNKYRTVVEVKPFYPLKTGIIITGSEVYYGRIQDKFGEVLKEKISYYGGELVEIAYAPDEQEFIQGLIGSMLDKGAEVILISGGMAVDADDVTPQAIAGMATEVIAYGVPILPGAMSMIAYREKVALLGVPACAMFHQTTVLDLVLPRIFAREKPGKDDVAAWAHGGICLRCEVCHYPNCAFGK